MGTGGPDVYNYSELDIAYSYCNFSNAGRKKNQMQVEISCSHDTN